MRSDTLFRLDAAEAAATDGSVDQPLRVVDLFVGAGGLSQGFQQAGFRIMAGADVDPMPARPSRPTLLTC